MGRRIREILSRLLRPGWGVVLACAGITVLFEIWIFALRHEGEPLAYVGYLVSAYSLVILVIALADLVQERMLTPFLKWLHGIPLAVRLLDDVPYRSLVLFQLSFLMNLAYTAFELVLGIRARSWWFVTLAVYYLLLSLSRFLLLRGTHSDTLGADLPRELRLYRLIGMFLLLLNIILSGMVILVLHDEGNFTYGEHVIYLMVIYSFYLVISSVVNLVRFRKYHSPLLSASRALQLATALVSMLSLQCAMIARFGRGNAENFRTTMVGSTGAVIFVLYIFIGLYMILSSTRKLRQLR